jgi:hypothetical protein
VVLPYWQRWMAALPELPALASAEERELLLLWQGLGCDSLARSLHRGPGCSRGSLWGAEGLSRVAVVPTAASLFGAPIPERTLRQGPGPAGAELVDPLVPRS